MVSDEEQGSLEFERHSFFGSLFEVSLDDPAFRRLFRLTYKQLNVEDNASASVQFILRSTNTESGWPELTVNSRLDNLADAFTEGTNRRRFTVREVSANGTTRHEVSDAFLGSKPVMMIDKQTAHLLDPERSYATTESIIFHTVLALIPGYHIMHAGVVSWGEKAIVLCGEANRGKTTLTLGLVRAGFKFLSDEIAFVDRVRERVFPFPRAVGMRKNSFRMFPEIKAHDLLETRSLGGEAKWLVDVDSVFPGSLGSEARLEAIVFLEGFAESPRITPMTSSEALFECMKVTHSAEGDPMLLMLNVAEIVNRARCYRLRSGNVHDTAKAISELIRR